jgi:group I intron endonuclease
MIYIGQTIISVECRWKNHKKSSKKLDYYLYRSMRKYGIENFTVEQIDIANSLEELNFLEQKYIKELNSLSPNGYNLALGGKNSKPSEESKLKMSIAQKNSPKSIENIAKLAILNRGSKASLETKKKLSEIRKGEKHYRYGKHCSDETKIKIAGSLSGKPVPSKYKKVLCVETGQVFESVKEAARILEIHRGLISDAARFGYKNRKTGFSFRFV